MDFSSVIGTLISLAVGIFVLGILVVVHETGHFLLAKLCGVGVVEYSIGFGKKIWQKRINGTRYSIGAIPLGGYVRMVGDDPRKVYGGEEEESADATIQPIDEDEDEETLRLLADESKWFLKKSYPAKAAIVLAGPGFNLLFAFFIVFFAVLFSGTHKPVDEPIIGHVMKTQEMGMEVKAESPAYKVGIQEGDKVLSIDGKVLKDWQDLAGTIRASGGKELSFVIERKDKEDENKVETIELKVQPIREPSDMALATGNDDKQDYVIGISPKLEERKVGVLEAAKIGVLNTYGTIILTLKSIKALVLGKISPKSLGGPIAIVKGAGQSASAGVDKLFGFIMFLSVSLGVLNLLPIPVLDGGHLIFFTIGFIKRSPVSVKTQEFLTRIGMAFLLALMLFALCNDIVRLFD